MNTYINLIEKVEVIRRKVKDLIERFPRDKRKEILFDKWSLKDVVAHLSTWMVHDIDCLKSLMEGVEPYWEPDVEKFNENGVNARRGRSWEEVYKEFVNLIAESDKIYRQLPENLWRVRIWKDQDETAEKFLEEEIKHWEGEHLPLLEKVIKTVTR